MRSGRAGSSEACRERSDGDSGVVVSEIVLIGPVPPRAWLLPVRESRSVRARLSGSIQPGFGELQPALYRGWGQGRPDLAPARHARGCGAFDHNPPGARPRV